MQRLLNEITGQPLVSSSLELLRARILSPAFIRSSWFDRWTRDALEELPKGLLGRLRLFLLSLVGLDDGVRATHQTIRRVVRGGETFREFANNQIIDAIILKNASFFDSIEAYPLTPKQREAAASDEDATLVIAGAGTGKTSTILAKIGLLVRSGQCKPEELLAISYTNKSANELAERVKASLKIDVTVSTFHKLGSNILARAENGKPTLAAFASEPLEKAKCIESILDALKANRTFLSELVNFLAYQRIADRQIWDFRSLAEYKEWIRSNKLVSLDGIPKKSFQECVITNWLVLNGIRFEYESQYPFNTKTPEYRQYCPDFYLPDYDIYIEHFGIDEAGRTAPFINAKLYLQSMVWKRATHKKYGTTLIETYSWEHVKGILLSNLEKNLQTHACKINPISIEDALEMINRSGLISGFAELVSTFLTLYKGNGSTLVNDDVLKTMFGHAREKAFMKLFDPIFREYEQRNRAKNQIDFEDMITRAARAVRDGAFASPYRYILIDEFQDISPGRAELVRNLRQSHQDCAVFVVGDDWQSIYRFAGSDIGGMTRFEEMFGVTRRVALDTTFRFDDNAILVSSTFVLKNRAQIKKDLVPIKKAESPSLIVYKRADEESPLDWSLNAINSQAKEGTEVLILERYKFHLPQEEEWARLQKCFPRLRLNKMSIHAAKGLEADYVIMGLRGGPWGFPSQVVDDPLLDLVLTQADEYPFGEERRLFYVALTRARNKTYLVCETGQDRSVFAEELESGREYPISVFGVDTKKLNCPKCLSGSMLLRDGSNGQFYGCSNYPLCRHTDQICPECRKGLLVVDYGQSCSCHICGHKAEMCPKCRTGVLQRKSGPYGVFLGCSNYKDPEIKCDYKRNISN